MALGNSRGIGMCTLSLLILLLSCTFCYSLDIHGEFQVGHDVESPNAFAYVYLEVTQTPAMLYGSWRTWFELESLWGTPFRDIYELGLQLSWRSLFVDLNHFCNHPVWSRSNQSSWLDNRWGQAITVLSIGMKW